MSRQPAPTTVQRLADELVPGGDPLHEEITGWLASSRRFRAFAREHRDKIRKKLRSATDADARLDVRAELRVAHLLLADRRIGLAFEAYGAARGGPDFSLTFRDAPSLNLEVTRPRGAALAGPLLTKLHQLPPSRPNAVIFALDGDPPADAIAATLRDLRARADAKDEAFFVARGFEGSKAFYQRLLRLGGIFAWRDGADADLWINGSSRIPLPERASRAVVACLSA
ncbi:MAG TPA: hypothetical protein VFW95_07465 [Candidatus Limnocylindria bacterium]|nr:hypothetical protein [Candidatus Limnocylindria bacterium]